MWNNNNPVAYSDPSGYCIEDLCIGEGLYALFAIGGFLTTHPEIIESLSNPGAPSPIAAESAAARLVLWKGALPALEGGERILDLPPMPGWTPQQYMARNMGKLRSAMSDANPIRDSYVNADGSLKDAGIAF